MLRRITNNRIPLEDDVNSERDLLQLKEFRGWVKRSSGDAYRSLPGINYPTLLQNNGPLCGSDFHVVRITQTYALPLRSRKLPGRMTQRDLWVKDFIVSLSVCVCLCETVPIQCFSQIRDLAQ